MLGVSDWYRCATCDMAHPWRPEEKGCPNAAIVARTGLKGLEALKASGLFDRFEKPAPVNIEPVNIEPVNMPAAVNSPTPSSTDRKAYFREYMRQRRDRQRELIATSSAAA
jgi:hypothetical protein